MASVFNAEELEAGAYSVSEWTGGVTLGDRLESDETIPVDEFLPNAAGLADALAALHREGHVHGAIDPYAVFHTVAHPAQLGAFGRVPVDHTPSDDVRSLGAVLEVGLTGSPPGGPPPSEIVDGLDRAVDHALRTAQLGHLTARQFADLLRAAPSPLPPSTATGPGSGRFLLAAGALVVAGLLLIGLGRLLTDDSDRPPLFPSTTAVSDTVALPETTTSTTGVDPLTPPTIAALSEVAVVAVQSVDPFGDGERERRTVGQSHRRGPRHRVENGALSRSASAAQTWRGSRLSKWQRVPAEISISGIEPGTAYEVVWATNPPDPDTWEVIVRGRVGAGTPRHQLPDREGGLWVVWLTELPFIEVDDHSTEIAEVRFRR
jgi:hypothetical protein